MRRRVHVYRLDKSIFTAQTTSALANSLAEFRGRFITLLGDDDTIVRALPVT